MDNSHKKSEKPERAATGLAKPTNKIVNNGITDSPVNKGSRDKSRNAKGTTFLRSHQDGGKETFS